NNPSVVIDRECFDRVGLFDEKMFFAADWDMWLRIAEKYEIKYIAQPLSKYRLIRDYRQAHPGEAEADYLSVLAKVWARNPGLSGRLKRQALSEVYTDMFYVNFRNRKTVAAARSALALFLTDPGRSAALIGARFKRKKEENF
ncbi:MAG: hypothetical protein PHG97_03095, partial [Candidatus Margulisbacteria bacterium]|nr:hypothetical protein [Candidatus Margulisiibacteriota bacterium]